MTVINYYLQVFCFVFVIQYECNSIILYSNNIAQHFNITQNWNVSIEKKKQQQPLKTNFKCFSNKPTDHHGLHRANTQETETNIS